MRQLFVAVLGTAVFASSGACGGAGDPVDLEDASSPVDGGVAPDCEDALVRACGTDEGECVAGTQTCTSSRWSDCEGATGPVAELCNGLDDDCDGAVDEEFDVGVACDLDADGCLDDAIACTAAGDSACIESAPQATSRLGIDYLLPFMVKYHDDQWTEAYAALADAGVGWVNFADISPEAVHRGTAFEDDYWAMLDREVLRWQAAGFQIAMSLRTKGLELEAVPAELIEEICAQDADCAVAFDCERAGPNLCKGSDRLPFDSEHPEDPRGEYREWIATLVERYDCDGDGDAEGLVRPIRHFQIGNEYSNFAFWTGTAQDYGTLLEETRLAVAGQDVALISNGIRWNDLFHDMVQGGDPNGAEFERRVAEQHSHVADDYGQAWANAWTWHRTFVDATIGFAGLYDVLDAGGNGPYPTATEGYLDWVLGELPAAPPRVWDMEARAEPRLVCKDLLQTHCELTVDGGAGVLDALWAEAHDEPFDAHPIEWYRDEQAAILGQVLVKRFAAGAEKVFIGQVSDWNDPLTDGLAMWASENVFVGLVDSDGNPQPAFYAYLLGARLTNGFSGVETILKNTGAETGELEGDEIELHRFSFADEPDVLVGWLAEEAQHGTGISRGPSGMAPTATLAIDDEIDPNGAPFCVYRTPTTADPEAAPVQVTTDATGALLVDLTPAPVYIVQAGGDGTCP
ncbi:MAG: hypothetical protein HYY06_33225 [Deltaproteobacteria bacterium]|nr:hypothetical protein [Deltaproteobacteria bacterium]